MAWSVFSVLYVCVVCQGQGLGGVRVGKVGVVDGAACLPMTPPNVQAAK